MEKEKTRNTQTTRSITTDARKGNLVYLDGTTFEDRRGTKATERRQRSVVGVLLYIPVGVWNANEKGAPTPGDLMEALISDEKPPVSALKEVAALATLIDQGALESSDEKEATPTKATSRYTEFTTKIYRAGMKFSTFRKAYLKEKPEAADATIKAQFYRISKEKS